MSDPSVCGMVGFFIGWNLAWAGAAAITFIHRAAIERLIQRDVEAHEELVRLIKQRRREEDWWKGQGGDSEG